jgi:DNA helicase II / ATP-dependent DNA helicase PcrA
VAAHPVRLDEQMVCEERATSARCSQEICDFASAIFLNFDPITSTRQSHHGTDGLHIVASGDVESYVAKYQPKVLRNQRNVDTLGLDAINIGVSKGCTYDRVLIFPTNPMRTFIADGNPTKLKAPEKLYVAVTRARHSVGFVI